MKRILAVLMGLLLSCTFAVGSAAEHPVPDLTKNGSLTLKMELDGKALDGGKLNLYKIGEITEEDGNYGFCAIDQLQDIDVDLEATGEKRKSSCMGRKRRIYPKSPPRLQGGKPHLPILRWVSTWCGRRKPMRRKDICRLNPF